MPPRRKSLSRSPTSLSSRKVERGLSKFLLLELVLDILELASPRRQRLQPRLLLAAVAIFLGGPLPGFVDLLDDGVVLPGLGGARLGEQRSGCPPRPNASASPLTAALNAGSLPCASSRCARARSSRLSSAPTISWSMAAIRASAFSSSSRVGPPARPRPTAAFSSLVTSSPAAAAICCCRSACSRNRNGISFSMAKFARASGKPTSPGDQAVEILDEVVLAVVLGAEAALPQVQ